MLYNTTKLPTIIEKQLFQANFLRVWNFSKYIYNRNNQIDKIIKQPSLPKGAMLEALRKWYFLNKMEIDKKYSIDA